MSTAVFSQEYRSNLYLKDADSPAGEGICCPLVEGDEQLTSMSGGVKCRASYLYSVPGEEEEDQ